ncbi:MAG: MerR family DNA-binding transcriptional regulator, partial [Hyphomonas sp.]|nr:MerR family DNA-binding transcriptional regulator [Hyphomonas sp.]
DKDMLHPARDGMMRLYSNRDRARLTIIVRLKRLGLPLADIREILDLYALNDGKRAQTRMMLEKFRKQAAELEVQRGDIETALHELYKGIEWLEDLVANNGQSEETKRQAAAYEQVARKQLDEV